MNIKIAPARRKPFAQMSPAAMHRKFGLRGLKCEGCGRDAAIAVRVLASVDDLKKSNPALLAGIALTSPKPGHLPVIPTIYGDMLLMSRVGACETCRPSLERSAAKGTAGVGTIVEIDRQGLEGSYATQSK